MRHVPSVLLAALVLTLSYAPAGAQAFENGLAAARAKDYAGAYAQWQPLAQGGHADAQYNIGVLFEAGLGTAKNYDEAAIWYTQAAAQGHAGAQYNLGIMFAEGRGVPQSDNRAAGWLRKAAAQNHAKAQYNLGVLYQFGRGVDKDLAQSRIWFDRAAANGITPPKNAPPKSAAAAGTKSNAAKVAHRRIPGTPPAPPTAAPPDQPLEVATFLQAGLRYRLELTDTQQLIRDGATQEWLTVVIDIDLAVTQVSSGGAVFQWIFGMPAVQKTDGSLSSRISTQSYKMLEGERILYRTDGSGAVTGLGNSHEVETLFNAIVDRSLGDVERETNNPFTIETYRASLEPMRRGPYMEDLALELPKLLHFFSGRTLEASKRYSQSKVVRLSLNGAEVPSRLNYELAWFDPTNQIGWLRWSQTADRGRTANVVEAVSREIADRAGRRLPRRFDVGSVGVSEEAVYEIDLETGLPKSVVFSRDTKMLGFSVIERTQIRVLQ